MGPHTRSPTNSSAAIVHRDTWALGMPPLRAAVASTCQANPAEEACDRYRGSRSHLQCGILDAGPLAAAIPFEPFRHRRRLRAVVLWPNVFSKHSMTISKTCVYEANGRDRGCPWHNLQFHSTPKSRHRSPRMGLAPSDRYGLDREKG